MGAKTDFDDRVCIRAEEMAFRQTGLDFGMLPKTEQYRIWSMAEADVINADVARAEAFCDRGR